MGTHLSPHLVVPQEQYLRFRCISKLATQMDNQSLRNFTSNRNTNNGYIINEIGKDNSNVLQTAYFADSEYCSSGLCINEESNLYKYHSHKAEDNSEIVHPSIYYESYEKGLSSTIYCTQEVGQSTKLLETENIQTNYKPLLNRNYKLKILSCTQGRYRENLLQDTEGNTFVDKENLLYIEIEIKDPNEKVTTELNNAFNIFILEGKNYIQFMPESPIETNNRAYILTFRFKCNIERRYFALIFTLNSFPDIEYRFPEDKKKVFSFSIQTI